jgi:hypothetical protein
MDNIEDQVLNHLILIAYWDEARGYTIDSLLNYLGTYEKQIEVRLGTEFENKSFTIKPLTSGLKPPKRMIDAIEQRNNATQQAEQVKNELAVSEMQFRKARIDAEANRVKSAGLTKEVLHQQ